MSVDHRFANCCFSKEVRVRIIEQETHGPRDLGKFRVRVHASSVMPRCCLIYSP